MREGWVKKILLAAALGGSAFFSGSSVLLAQAPTGLLPPGERKAYHACLKAKWVDDYCRARAVGALWNYGAVFDACLIANGIPPRQFVADVRARDLCTYLLRTGPY
jgi:hypothetical protein